MLLKIVEDALNRYMDEHGPPLPERRVKPMAEVVEAEIRARLPMVIGVVGVSDQGLDSIAVSERFVDGSLKFKPGFSQTKLDKGISNLENGQLIRLLILPPETKQKPGVFIPIPPQPALDPVEDGNKDQDGNVIDNSGES